MDDDRNGFVKEPFDVSVEPVGRQLAKAKSKKKQGHKPCFKVSRDPYPLPGQRASAPKI